MPTVNVVATMDPQVDARSQAASDATVEVLKKLTNKGTSVPKLNNGDASRSTVSSGGG